MRTNLHTFLKRNFSVPLVLGGLIIAITACIREQAEIIVITATFLPPTQIANATSATITLPTPIQLPLPIVDIAAAAQSSVPRTYIVQAGDTLTRIAQDNGVSVETLLSLNAIANPDLLSVGQVILLPHVPTVVGSSAVLLPNSRLVRAPGVSDFDIAAFVHSQPGYIRIASDEINDVSYSAADLVNRVALEFSVDPRLLLALLEYKSGWLTNPNPSEVQRNYPLQVPTSLSGFDRRGLYRQLAWAADNLNYGYYVWQRGGIPVLEFSDGVRVLIAHEINDATRGLQYLLSRTSTYAEWAEQVSTEGFVQTYSQLFGDPFVNATDDIVPTESLAQPELGLPFSSGETWYYTGGPHGGWGSGSAWAAVDFAPPDDPSLQDSSCYISDYFVTAVASGVISRVDEGTVILDLDHDGDESTGWTILYLHIASEDRVEAGTIVNAGDPIGRPSCEGGFSNGTHVHIARRFNGEWMPADCAACGNRLRPPFVLGGWRVEGLIGQEYQGFLTNQDSRIVAEQMRGIAPNEISW